jgi:hypothetical protein
VTSMAGKEMELKKATHKSEATSLISIRAFQFIWIWILALFHRKNWKNWNKILTILNFLIILSKFRRERSALKKHELQFFFVIAVWVSVVDPDPHGSAYILVCLIRIRTQEDVLFLCLKASPVAWTSFMEA